MRKYISLFKAVLFMVTLLSVSACKVGEIRNPEVSVTQAKFNSVSLKRGRLDTQLRVSNPNVFKLPIKTVSYKLYLNDKEFSSGVTQQSLNIPAGGSQLVGLPLDIEYKKILSGLGGAFLSKTIRFRLQGEIDLGLVNVPYSKTGVFKIN